MVREAWELPGLSGTKRMIRAALIVGLVAVAAIPWLSTGFL